MGATITTTISAKQRIIQITDGATTVNLDLANKQINILTGSGSSQITAKLDVGNGNIQLLKGDNTEISLALGDIPAASVAKMQQITVCEGGVNKTAYILMTTPA